MLRLWFLPWSVDVSGTQGKTTHGQALKPECLRKHGKAPFFLGVEMQLAKKGRNECVLEGKYS